MYTKWLFVSLFKLFLIIFNYDLIDITIMIIWYVPNIFIMCTFRLRKLKCLYFLKLNFNIHNSLHKIEKKY